jgi:ethanolamine ammonia-lyase large subunit
LGDPLAVTSRIDAIYRHARKSLYAAIDPAVIRDCCTKHLAISTRSADREDYLSHPSTGEWICDRDLARIGKMYAGHHSVPPIQIAVSDGLNADAVNENLRRVLPNMRRRIEEAGLRVGEVDIVLKNGRVRAGYHAAVAARSTILVHLIGERPGTGLNCLSAYITYGRDDAGGFRWRTDMDHSCTTAICGIHPRGKPPDAAVEDMVNCILRMLRFKCSGVALAPHIRDFSRSESGKNAAG